MYARSSIKLICAAAGAVEDVKLIVELLVTSVFERVRGLVRRLTRTPLRPKQQPAKQSARFKRGLSTEHPPHLSVAPESGRKLSHSKSAAANLVGALRKHESSSH